MITGTCRVIQKILQVLNKAYVLTPLPGKVFQVFQVEGEEEERENREYITNLFRPIILV